MIASAANQGRLTYLRWCAIGAAPKVAIDRDFRVVPNMRVPGSSVIDKLHSDASAERASGRENLESWEFSGGNTLPACEVWVEARKAGDRIISIVQLYRTTSELRTMICQAEMRYRADITAGSLKVPESRVIADLLLRGVDAQGWEEAIIGRNVLQARSPATARRLARLIRDRLGLMEDELWRLVLDGSGQVGVHACLAAAVKHSALLGDFLDLVVREQYRLFSPALSKKLWEGFLDDCRGRDPDMPLWNESTRRRLRSSVYQILAQAGYIDSTRSMKLQTVHIAAQVLHYLREHNEQYVLRCIEVAP